MRGMAKRVVNNPVHSERALPPSHSLHPHPHVEPVSLGIEGQSRVSEFCRQADENGQRVERAEEGWWVGVERKERENKEEEGEGMGEKLKKNKEEENEEEERLS